MVITLEIALGASPVLFLTILIFARAGGFVGGALGALQFFAATTAFLTWGGDWAA